MSRTPNGEQEFLHAYTPKDYPSVALTVDLVVLAVAGGVLHSALVRRGVHPFKGGLALPGGFVGVRESAEQAAFRELAEETGLDLGRLPVHVEQLATYSDPDRDPRMRVVSVAHLALLATDGQALPALSAGSDAAAAEWHPVHEVLEQPDGVRPRLNPPRWPGTAFGEDGVHHRRRPAGAGRVHHDTAPHRL